MDLDLTVGDWIEMEMGCGGEYSYNSAVSQQARAHKRSNAKVRILKSMECLTEFHTMHAKWGKHGNTW